MHQTTSASGLSGCFTMCLGGHLYLLVSSVIQVQTGPFNEGGGTKFKCLQTATPILHRMTLKRE